MNFLRYVYIALVLICGLHGIGMGIGTSESLVVKKGWLMFNITVILIVILIVSNVIQ